MEKVTVKVVRTEGDWLALVEACKKSGVSAAVFCRGQGVSYPLFLYHRSKILKKRGEILPSRGLGIFPTAGGRRAFIPVQVSEGRSVRLKFPRGLVLESNELPNASWLVEVAWRWNELETSLC
jgi:hypothetical protein